MSDENRLPSSENPDRLPVLRWWWVAVAAITALVMTATTAWLLLTTSDGVTLNQARVNLEAIRTSLSVGLGAGGALALWLAARRQRSTEIQLTENARIASENKAHQDRIAETTERDNAERRITELYTMAVEQLGSEKASVRLGGLYSLERLADDNEEHRQTIVNVICAYLRMPFDWYNIVNERGDWERSDESEVHNNRSASEELQVRLTAQRILSAHLNFSRESDGQRIKRWDDIEIDLAGATLIKFDLEGCELKNPNFSYATFVSMAMFVDTRFEGESSFFGARFEGNSNFRGSNFSSRAIFSHAEFAGRVFFKDAVFNRGLYLYGAKFEGLAEFSRCKFAGEVFFNEIEPPLSMPDVPEGLKEAGWPESTFLDLTKSSVQFASDAELKREWPSGWYEGNLVPEGSNSDAILYSAALLYEPRGNVT